MVGGLIMRMPNRRIMGGFNRCKIDYSFEANKVFYIFLLVLWFIVFIIGVCSKY